MNQNLKTPLFLVLIITILSFSPLFSQTYYEYKDDSVSIYASRVEVSEPCKVSTVKIWLSGNNSTGKARLRIFGNEGGAPIPNYEKDLIEPIYLTKKIYGLELVEIKLNKDLYFDRGQFFIAIDNLDKDVYWATSKTPIRPECQSNLYGVYTRQCFKDKANHWSTGEYSFALNVDMAPIANNVEKYFTVKELQSKSFTNDVNNGSLNVFDYDLDGYPDILYQGTLYHNIGNMDFSAVGTETGFTPIDSLVSCQILCNINNDDYLDVVCTHYPDSLNNDCSIYINKNGHFKEINITLGLHSPIINYSVSDVNGDGYEDIILLTKDVSNSLRIFLNNKMDSFEETKELSLLPQIYQACIFYDINKDTRKDMILLDANGIEYVYLNLGGMKYVEDKKIKTQRGSLLASNLKYSDINGDGWDEELSILNKGYNGNDNDQTSVFVRSLLDGIALEPTSLLPRTSFNEVQSGLCVKDFNNDGNDDMVISTGTACRYADLYLQDRYKRFNINNYESGFYKQSLGKDLCSADFDLDGKIDLCTIVDGKLQILHNQYDRVEPLKPYIDIQSKIKDKIKNVIIYANKGIAFKNVYNYELGILTQSATALHIGLNESSKIDSIQILTEDNKLYTDRNAKINTVYKVDLTVLDQTEHNVECIASPNPFLTAANIRLIVNVPGLYTLSIQTLDGQLIKTYTNLNLSVGEYNYMWDGNDSLGNVVSSGVYIYRLSGSNINIVNKLIKL